MWRRYVLSLIIFLTVGLSAFHTYYYIDSALERSEEPVEQAIISSQPESQKKDESNNEITIMFTGDVMLGRTVMTKSKEMNDYLYPVRMVHERLASADLTVINLENPIIEECPEHTGGYTFCSEPESVFALTVSGVDLANLANNHTYNWGVEGYDQTLSYLDSAGVATFGNENYAVKQINETKIGFVGFDFVTNGYGLNTKQIEMVKQLSSETDILVVSAHWGNEYKAIANQYQRNMAKDFVNMGSDLVIGHHPHWVQDIDCLSRDFSESVQASTINTIAKYTANDLYSGTDTSCMTGSIPVIYSLGNFVFDQMWSEETKKGIAVEVVFEDGVYKSHKSLPVYMSEWARPEWVDIQAN